MKQEFLIGILTFNATKLGRRNLLLETHRSIRAVFTGYDHRVVVCEAGVEDHGSFWKDQDAEHIYANKERNAEPGRGRNAIMEFWRRRLSDPEPEHVPIVILSDDDMHWCYGVDTPERLHYFWKAAPRDLVLVSGFLEPVWRWNIPRGRIDAGGRRAIWRDSAPGAAWTFPFDRWDRFGPIRDGFGSDYDACKDIIANGGRVAQMPLAEHSGWGKSTHGNNAIEFGQPFDRAKWGI